MKSKKLQLLYAIILPRPSFEIPPSYTDPIYRIDDAGAGRDSVASWNSVASLRSTSTPVRPRTVYNPEVDEFGVISPLPKRQRSDSTASETSYGEEINRQTDSFSFSKPTSSDRLRRKFSSKELLPSPSRRREILSLPQLGRPKSIDGNKACAKTMPARHRSQSLSRSVSCSFEVDLSPIIEDVKVFPDWKALQTQDDLPQDPNVLACSTNATCPSRSSRETTSRIPSVVLTFPTPELGSAEWTPGAEEGAVVQETIVPQFSLPSDDTSPLCESDTGPVRLKERKPCRRCTRSGSPCACEPSLEMEESFVCEQAMKATGSKRFWTTVRVRLSRSRRRLASMF